MGKKERRRGRNCTKSGDVIRNAEPIAPDYLPEIVAGAADSLELL